MGATGSQRDATIHLFFQQEKQNKWAPSAPRADPNQAGASIQVESAEQVPAVMTNCRFYLQRDYITQ